MRRFAPRSWDTPNLDDWIAALDKAVETSREPPLLVAHSLACLLVAHWQARSARVIRGAFMVAVPDPEGKAFPKEAASFADPPSGRLRFPSLVIASSDDPYGTLDYVRSRADGWGSGLVELGALGHLNAGSGLGAWSEGLALFTAFAAGTGLAQTRTAQSDPHL